MTLYDELKAAGCEMDNHESDLYVLATTETYVILNKHPEAHYTRFYSAIDGRYWLDLPFMYSPWWEHRRDQTFRYDLASFSEPRIILIADSVGSRRAVPRLGYVVLPQH